SLEFACRIKRVGNRQEQVPPGSQDPRQLCRHSRNVNEVFKYAGGYDAVETAIWKRKNLPIGVETNPVHDLSGRVSASDRNHFFGKVARGDGVAPLADGRGDLPRPTAQVKNVTSSRTDLG